MDRARRFAPWAWGIVCAALACPVVAEDSAVRPGFAPIKEALSITKSEGKPSVVVVTDGSAGQARLLDPLPALLRARHLDQAMSLVAVDGQASPEVARHLGVRQTPVVVVYGGPMPDGRLEVLGHRAGESDPYAVMSWLVGLVSDRVKLDTSLARASASMDAPRDAALQQTQYGSGQSPTPQWQPPYCPPQAPPQAPVVYPQPAPVYQAPAPIMVTPPSAPIVVQPPTQTIVMAPPSAPNIIFASAPTASAPTMSYAPTGSAPPSTPNIFMAPTGNAPTGNAPTAMAPVMMAPAAQPVMMAPAAQPMAMAPMGAAPSVGQGPLAVAALTMIAPSLIDRLIGTLGEHMAQRRNPRVRVSEAPSYSLAPTAAMAPTGAAPGGGYAAVPGYGVVPGYGMGYGGGPGYGYPPPGYGYPPPPDYGQPPYPVPSPQAPAKHGWSNFWRR